METKFKSIMRTTCHSCGVVYPVAIILHFGVLAGHAQTGDFLFTGSEMTITLNPGTYDITAYGAQGGIGEFGSVGGLGAQMQGAFSFKVATTLTLLVGGVGGNAPLSGSANATSGGGGGGSFVVYGAIPLVIAGGGGGGGGVGTAEPGGAGGTDQSGQAGAGFAGGAGGSDGSGGSAGNFPSGTGGGGGGFYTSGGTGYFDGGGGGGYLSGGAGGSGIYNGYLIGGFGGYGGGAGGGYGFCAGGGGGGYSGGGGGIGQGGSYGGGGGGSIIDSSAINLLAEVSGIASPNGSPNGEIIITAAPEPTTLALAGLGGLSLLLFRRQRT